jgi:outer membrane immunogenic protein
MKKLVLAAFCLVFASAQVFAQAKNFEGFSLIANVQSSRTNVDLSSGASDSGTSTGLGLQGQYTFALNNQYVLGVGVALGLNNRNASSASGTVGLDGYTRNNTSFEFMPGIALSNTTLLFGKISATTGTFTADSTGAPSLGLTGLGYGIGVKYLIDKNVFWQVSYDLNRFNDSTNAGVTYTIKPTIFSLGVGYNF